jgi:hypothetical protein
MLVDAALVSIVKGGDGAASALSRLEPRKAVLPKTRAFIADYSYDFASPQLAAEIWAQAGGEQNLVRVASALYLAGSFENARNLWLLLAKESNNAGWTAENATRSRLLFNLAATAGEDSEKIQYLEQLLSSGDAGGVAVPALILYTRLLPDDRAKAVLFEHPLATREPLLDMERVRRAALPGRAAADVWLLLNRHPDDSRLYRWAAWYFERQRHYDDLDALTRLAAQNEAESPYMSFHKALSLARQGNIGEAAAMLEGLDGHPSWQRPANLGLLSDSSREYAAALRYYAEAAALIPDSPDAALRVQAARLYLKMARCRRILGESKEAVRNDLERALSFDSENVDARLALSRLDQR